MESPNDVATFTNLLTALSKYFPESKVDIEAILEGYFEDLSALPIDTVHLVFREARRTCTFFPKIAELLAIAGSMNAVPGFHCPQCHGGHGAHAEHQVAHYPAGPWCMTCQADMPTPAQYAYHAPYTQRLALEAPAPRTSRQLSAPSDVPTVLRGILADLAEHGSGARSASDAKWARAHVAMFEAGVAAPGRAADAIAWCERMAEEDPENASDWLREAETYRLDLDNQEIPF